MKHMEQTTVRVFLLVKALPHFNDFQKLLPIYKTVVKIVAVMKEKL